MRKFPIYLPFFVRSKVPLYGKQEDLRLRTRPKGSHVGINYSPLGWSLTVHSLSGFRDNKEGLTVLTEVQEIVAKQVVKRSFKTDTIGLNLRGI